MVIFGVGGAARVISVEMAIAGVRKIIWVNRDGQRGLELLALLEGEVTEVISVLNSLL